MKIITITNQKGGEAKSTTAETLSAGLTKKGFRVLSIDMDGQANFSLSQNADKSKPTLLGVLTGEVKIENAIQKTNCGDFIPANKALSNADTILSDTGKEYKLKEALATIPGLYDYIVIDTPPALNVLTVNALTACNSVIIPTQANIYSISGIDRLKDTIATIKKYCNQALSIEGILLTRYSDRSTISKQLTNVINDLADKLNTKVYKSRIRESSIVREAQVCKQNIFDYSPKSKVAIDYDNFINEFLEDNK